MRRGVAGAFLALMILGGGVPAAASPFEVVIERIAGVDRSGTSIAVSQLGWDTASHVLLATGEDFPDALGSTALAASLDAPLLLLPGGHLSEPVLEELERLGTEEVTILGGGDVVEGSAEFYLGEQGIGAQRLAGVDRYATAAAAALAAGLSPTGQAVVASGEFFADAVAAGALSGGPDRLPVLLASMTDVPDASMAALADLDVAKVLVLGGTGILGPEIEVELVGAGITVARIAGPDRFATSARVATEAWARLGDGPARFILAAGTTFADALAAGPLVARSGGVLLLVPPNDLALAPEGIRFMRDRAAGLQDPVLLGGTAAVNGIVDWQTRAVLAGDPLPAAAFTDGVYKLSDGFPAGTYRTLASVEGCYWERLRGFSGAPSEIIANDISNDSMVVTVLPSDAGLRVSGCAIWSADLIPDPLSNRATTEPFVDGTWLVARQIEPGHQRATGGAGCFWQRLSGFTGEPEEVIAYGSSSSVTIGTGDLGFRSRRCGTWTSVG